MLLPTKMRRLRQHYNVKSALRAGEGSQLRVVEARGSGQVFVCKTVKRNELSQNMHEDAKRFRDAEVNGMRLVKSHPNVVQIEDVFEDKEGLHIVMELCLYGDVLDYVSSKGRLDEKEALHITRQVASALRDCHLKGLVHRDVKPENIFISGWKYSNGGMMPDVKLGDFGSSVVLKPSEQVSQAAGTLDYTAPQVLMGEFYSSEVDIWSLGVSLYAMLTGCLPFLGDSNTETFSNVLNQKIDFKNKFWNTLSPETVHLLQWMLNREPQHRPTASDVLGHSSMKKLSPDSEPKEGRSGEFSPRSPLQMAETSKTLHIALTSSKQAMQDKKKALRSLSR